MNSEAGKLFNRAAQIASMLERGIVWTPDDMLATEYAALEHIWNEQNKWKRDMAKQGKMVG